MQGTNNRNQRSERGGSPRHYSAAAASDRSTSINKNARPASDTVNDRLRYDLREIYRLNDLYERGSI